MADWVPPGYRQKTAADFLPLPSRLLLVNRYDLQLMQELLGHRDVSTTMISTHVLNRGGSVICSSADRLRL